MIPETRIGGQEIVALMDAFGIGDVNRPSDANLTEN